MILKLAQAFRLNSTAQLLAQNPFQSSPSPILLAQTPSFSLPARRQSPSNPAAAAESLLLGLTLFISRRPLCPSRSSTRRFLPSQISSLSFFLCGFASATTLFHVISVGRDSWLLAATSIVRSRPPFAALFSAAAQPADAANPILIRRLISLSLSCFAIVAQLGLHRLILHLFHLHYRQQTLTTAAAAASGSRPARFHLSLRRPLRRAAVCPSPSACTDYPSASLPQQPR